MLHFTFPLPPFLLPRHELREALRCAEAKRFDQRRAHNGALQGARGEAPRRARQVLNASARRNDTTSLSNICQILSDFRDSRLPSWQISSNLRLRTSDQCPDHSRTIETKNNIRQQPFHNLCIVPTHWALLSSSIQIKISLLQHSHWTRRFDWCKQRTRPVHELLMNASLFLATATAKPSDFFCLKGTTWFLPSPSFPAATLCDLLGLVEWHIPMSKLCERPDYLGTDRSRNTTLNGPGNQSCHSCHSFACVSWFAHVSLSDTFSNLQQMSPNISKCLTIPTSSDLRLGILGMLRFDSPNLCFWHYMDLHGW